MTVSGKSFFATACVLSFSVAKKLEFLTETHTNYFDENVNEMARLLANNMQRETIHAV
jgi:hypothetical protein